MQKWYALFRDALAGKEHDFTTGSTDRAIAMLAVPMMLEMAMESIFALVDTFFVGQVSVSALTTVGLTEVVLTLVYAVAVGLSIAPMAMIARFVGEKDEFGAARAARQSIWIAIAFSIIVAVPGIIFAEDILRLMGGSPQTVREGANYTRIMFGGNVVIMLLFLLNGVFRGAGEAARAMRVLWIANGINIVLDPIFIFGFGPIPALGVTGAAVATTIGRGVGVAYQLYILLGGRSSVKLAVGSWGFDGAMIMRLLRIAVNGAFQNVIASASWIVLARIIASFGDAAVAGYTIAIRLLIFTLLPTWGLANAAATFVGQNLGAGQPERAARGVWRAAYYSLFYLGGVGLLYFFGAQWLVGWFTDSPAALAPGVQVLRVFGIGYVTFGLGMIFLQAFNGSGDTATPTKVNFIGFWLIETPLALLLATQLGYGVPGVAWSVIAAETVITVIAIVLFRRGKWKTTVV